MNAALWKKSIYESRWLLLSSVVFMFAVHWLRVWISSFFSVERLKGMFSFMPEVVEQLLPVPFSQIATSAGRIAVAYDDPIVLLLVTVWAISRGSDAVSGELNRGTMEMVLAQPVTRLGVLGTQAAVTLGGAALLGLGSLAGHERRLWRRSRSKRQCRRRVFVPAALNLFAMTVFLAGLTTMVSSGTNYRSHTIGIVGGLLRRVDDREDRRPHGARLEVADLYARSSRPSSRNCWSSDLPKAWSLWVGTAGGSFELGGLGYDSILIGLGLACYAAAAIVFCRRDLPAPL